MGFAVNRRRIRLTDGGWIDHTRTSHIQHPRRKQERTCSAIGHGSESYSCSCSYIIPKLHSNNCYILQMSPDSFHSAVYVRSKHTNNTECCFFLYSLYAFFLLFLLFHFPLGFLYYIPAYGEGCGKKSTNPLVRALSIRHVARVFFSPHFIYISSVCSIVDAYFLFFCCFSFHSILFYFAYNFSQSENCERTYTATPSRWLDFATLKKVADTQQQTATIEYAIEILKPNNDRIGKWMK